MTKQYVLKAMLKNGKVLYLTEVRNGYPMKSQNVADAMVFTTKASAWAEYKKISASNIGYEEWSLVELTK